MSLMLNLDALHSELPTDCVSVNTVVDLDHIQYPGIFGTGFFARRNREVFYFTALHCIRTNCGEPLSKFATLMIPYRHTGKTSSASEYILVETGFTIGGSSPDDWLDLIAFPVIEKTERSHDYAHLLARCAKLPASATWLDDYLASDDGRLAIESGHNSAYAVGHPKGSQKNLIAYAEEGGESVVSVETVVIAGTVKRSKVKGHFSLQCDPSPYGFSGFSGAPVFAEIKTSQGPQFTLLGMAVCASSKELNFLPIGKLLAAIDSDV